MTNCFEQNLIQANLLSFTLAPWTDEYLCRRSDYGQVGPGGLEDKWRHTYPYVPTSYYYHSPPPRPQPESIGGSCIPLYCSH